MKVILNLLFVFPCLAFCKEEVKSCHSAREFITASEFLKKEQAFPAHSQDLQKVALKVASGCDGSAQRFKNVFQTLDKAKFPRHLIINIALEFAHRSDAQTKAFCFSFQKAFLKKYLDMTQQDALKLAQSLSGSLDEELSVSADDFEKMVAFCIHHKQLSLPKEYCAKKALTLAKYAGQNRKSLFSDFKKLYTWFHKERPGQMPVIEAMDWALRVVSGGALAKENFLKSFQYLKNSSDFPINTKEQIELALKVSQLSQKEPHSN